jgi:uncharacterized membrane protein YhaH (DUF805 family)
MAYLMLGFYGRISAREFLGGASLLILITAILKLSAYIGSGIGLIAAGLSLVLVLPWIALWTKRYHDSGQSGWMIIMPVIVMFILYGISMYVVGAMIPIDSMPVKFALNSGTYLDAFRVFLEISRPQVVLSTFAGAIVQFIVIFLFNSIIRSDPGENKYG